jgi:hypothetical protein
MTRTEEIHWKGGAKGLVNSGTIHCHEMRLRASSALAEMGFVEPFIHFSKPVAPKQSHWFC